jgi:hypothetical protein
MPSPFNTSLDVNNSTTTNKNINNKENNENDNDVYKPGDVEIIYSDNIIYGNENISNNLANTNYYYKTNSYRTISSLAAGSFTGSFAGSSILLGKPNHNLSKIADLNATSDSSNECNNNSNNHTTDYYSGNENVANNNNININSMKKNNVNINNIYNNKTENCSLAEQRITSLSNDNYLNSTTNKANKLYDDHNLLSSTLNQIDKEHQFCQKSYFDKLPPDIEISVYGSETLPENSVLEADNTANTSGGETDNSVINNYSIKNKRFLRTRYIYFLFLWS